jgi:ribonuclease HII
MRWSTIERDLRSQHGPLIAGVDEVGRGPLAGPVVACAVVMPPERRAMPGVNDSKQLTAKKRERIVQKILANAIAVGIGAASVREIDRYNILQASHLAMRRALRRLSVTPNHVVVDGRAVRTLEMPHTAVVHGDARCYSIACASIVAKITRDRVMRALAARYPLYRWEENVGYATAYHLRGINEHGVTPHHRRSFLPVRQLSLDFAAAAEVVLDAEQMSRLIADAMERPPELITAETPADLGALDGPSVELTSPQQPGAP